MKILSIIEINGNERDNVANFVSSGQILIIAALNRQKLWENAESSLCVGAGVRQVIGPREPFEDPVTFLTVEAFLSDPDFLGIITKYLREH